VDAGGTLTRSRPFAGLNGASKDCTARSSPPRRGRRPASSKELRPPLTPTTGAQETDHHLRGPPSSVCSVEASAPRRSAASPRGVLPHQRPQPDSRRCAAIGATGCISLNAPGRDADPPCSITGTTGGVLLMPQLDHIQALSPSTVPGRSGGRKRGPSCGHRSWPRGPINAQGQRHHGCWSTPAPLGGGAGAWTLPRRTGGTTCWAAQAGQGADPRPPPITPPISYLEGSTAPRWFQSRPAHVGGRQRPGALTKRVSTHGFTARLRRVAR